MSSRLRLELLSTHNMPISSGYHACCRADCGGDDDDHGGDHDGDDDYYLL